MKTKLDVFLWQPPYFPKLSAVFIPVLFVYHAWLLLWLLDCYQLPCQLQYSSWPPILNLSLSSMLVYYFHPPSCSAHTNMCEKVASNISSNRLPRFKAAHSVKAHRWTSLSFLWVCVNVYCLFSDLAMFVRECFWYLRLDFHITCWTAVQLIKFKADFFIWLSRAL